LVRLVRQAREEHQEIKVQRELTVRRAQPVLLVPRVFLVQSV
jgi:hypothetical protein